jgi:hypothetical protein
MNVALENAKRVDENQKGFHVSRRRVGGDRLLKIDESERTQRDSVFDKFHKFPHF